MDGTTGHYLVKPGTLLNIYCRLATNKHYIYNLHYNAQISFAFSLRFFTYAIYT